MPHSTSASMTRFLDQQTRTNYPTTVIKSDKIWTRSTRRTIEVKEQSGTDADVRNRHPLHSFPTRRLLLYRNAARRWWHTIYRPQLEASVGRVAAGNVALCCTIALLLVFVGDAYGVNLAIIAMSSSPIYTNRGDRRLWMAGRTGEASYSSGCFSAFGGIHT